MEVAWGLVKVAVKAVVRAVVKVNAENHAKVIVAGFAVTHVMAPVVEIAECRAVVLVSGHVRTTAQERVELHVP